MTTDNLTATAAPTEALALVARLVGAPDGPIQPIEERLDALERFVREDLMAFSRDGAPPHGAELYDELEAGLERFREVTEFPAVDGKRVIGLGGGFSAGKSSFINALFGTRALPQKIRPTTAVPTYVISGSRPEACALNAFGRKVPLAEADLKTLTHALSEQLGMSFGHLLRAVFVQLESPRFPLLAFLDTPGYSKPDGESYARATDERLARAQLRGVDAILWLIDAEQGAIPQSDLQFLQSLGTDAPILVLFNKAEKKESDLPGILDGAREHLATSGLNVAGVLAVSSHHLDRYGFAEAVGRLEAWNREPVGQTLNEGFRRFFAAYDEFFDEQIATDERMLSRLNQISLLVDGDSSARQPLKLALDEVRTSLQTHKERKRRLKDLETAFFARLNDAAQLAGLLGPDVDSLGSYKNTGSPLSAMREARRQLKREQDLGLAGVVGEAFHEAWRPPSRSASNKLEDVVAATLAQSSIRSKESIV